MLLQQQLQQLALHLALSSMRLKRGDKVLMSVNSFVNLQKL